MFTLFLYSCLDTCVWNTYCGEQNRINLGKIILIYHQLEIMLGGEKQRQSSPLLPRLDFTPSLLTPLPYFPEQIRLKRNVGLWSVCKSSSLLFLPPQSFLCSSMGPSHRLQFFMNLSRLGYRPSVKDWSNLSLHGLQFFQFSKYFKCIFQVLNWKGLCFLLHVLV